MQIKSAIFQGSNFSSVEDHLIVVDLVLMP